MRTPRARQSWTTGRFDDEPDGRHRFRSGAVLPCSRKILRCPDAASGEHRMTDLSIVSPGLLPAPNQVPDPLFARVLRRLAGSLSANFVILLIVLAGLPLAVWLDL